MRIIFGFYLILCCYVQAEDYSDRTSYGGGCDSDSVSTSQKLSTLTPNQFYKICPDQTSQSFGQPQCGDGTNFAFFFSRPAQKYANNEKLLIEFMGGGACWDANTCGYMSSHLSFPYAFNKFVGLSCSEIAKGVSDLNSKFPINMLCAGKVGDVDFREYNTVVVPYCTQDVHLGSNATTYGGDSTVLHKGAHNMMGTLRWIFANFPNPNHIALTGCSAGGTSLPVVYDLLNKHYNKFGVRTTQVNTIIDSPVYLTPKYFLKNALSNWNPWPILDRIGFHYQKWRYSVEYPTKVWDHVLKRGSNRDSWGFVSHTNDETSQLYYKWMSGNGEEYSDNDDDDVNNEDDNAGDYGDDARDRRLDGNDANQQWWYDLSASVNSIEFKHKNVKSFFIEDKGHCSFGLYYPLQVDGFEEWASNIFREERLVGRSGPAIPLFVSSIFIGLILTMAIFYKVHQERTIRVDDDYLIKDDVHARNTSCSTVIIALLLRFKNFPVTIGYMLTTTVYFWTMIFSNSFAHPLNNPSIGPTAIVLSRFGINNPSMVVYQNQIYRLLTSNFLCSGILTYCFVIISLWVCARPLEQLLKWRFLIACLLVLLGSNLLYATFANGASCSSMALVLGLNSFYVMVLRVTKGPACGVSTMTFFMFACCSLAFSFNSWLMLFSAILIGAGSAVALFDISLGAHSENTSEAGLTEFKQASPDFYLRRKPLYTVAGLYVILFVIILLGLPHPKELYLQAFFTGCDLMYSDEVNKITYEYYSNRDRTLEEGGSNDLCAQFCVPHLATRGVVFGAQRLAGLQLTKGSCETHGFDEHVADKTFKYFSYSLDVEIFTASGYRR